MNRSLSCPITGKKYMFAQEYFGKKVEEYGDVETLKKYFITKKAKSLIIRGYNAQEIRNILHVDDNELLPPDDPLIESIMSYHKMGNESKTKRTSMAIHDNKSDPDVAVFINNIKNL